MTNDEAAARARAMAAYRAAVAAGRICACDGPHLAYCPLIHPNEKESAK